MLVIGLTGGIGSGKSTVAELFATHGIPIVDADLIAREIVQPNQPAYSQLIEHFGPDILTKDKHIDRTLLRRIVFDNAIERAWLEQLLHPIIFNEIKYRLKKLSGPYCIVVIPLLFESERASFIDRILIVDTPEHLQVERAIARDKTNKAQIEAIMKSQISREQRLQKAHDIILNDGNLDDLVPQVNKLHHFYLKMAGR